LSIKATQRARLGSPCACFHCHGSDNEELAEGIKLMRAGDPLCLYEIICREAKGPWLADLAGHDEQGLHLEALIVRPQAVDVVLLFHVHNFLRGRDGIDGHIVVPAIS